MVAVVVDRHQARPGEALEVGNQRKSPLGGRVGGDRVGVAAPRLQRALREGRFLHLALEVLRQSFRPEFLNRIDEAVVFHALDQQNIQAIAKIQLRVLESRLEKMDMKLEVTSRALGQLARTKKLAHFSDLRTSRAYLEGDPAVRLCGHRHAKIVDFLFENPL